MYILISPKGTIAKREWRSGYYHIATQLDAYLLVSGLDYEYKSVYASVPLSPGNDESNVKNQLLRELQNIVPLFPEDEIVPIRPHTHKSLINFKMLSLVIGFMVISMYFLNPLTVLSSTIITANILF